MDIHKKSPYHVRCDLCGEDIFLPRGDYIAIIEKGVTSHFHNQLGKRCYSHYRDAPSKTLPHYI